MDAFRSMFESFMAPVMERLNNLEGNDTFISDSEMGSDAEGEEIIPVRGEDATARSGRPRRIAVKGIDKPKKK